MPVNKDSVQFASLAGFFRDEPAVPVPPQDNVYTRFAAYPLMGSALAPLIGTYASFVVLNVLLWAAASVATYQLARRLVRSDVAAPLAGLLVATAPAFEALAGQALPYVASYAAFVLALLLFENVQLFEPDTSVGTALGAGFAGGLGFLVYDLYMLPAFVVVYGVLRRMPVRNLVLVLVAMAVPRLTWQLYWQAAHLASYSHNETHPIEALQAWIDSSRTGETLVGKLKGYAFLAVHGALNIGAAFLFWPVLIALVELWLRRRADEAKWFVAVAIAGFAPALFMLSTWPHIPRWYGYGFPAVYILAAAFAVRCGIWIASTRETDSSRASLPRRATRWQLATAVVVLLPALLLANADVLGATKPMELLLFQPTQWSYLWSQ